MIRYLSVIAGAVIAAGLTHATPVTLNFEGFADSTVLTAQYAGVTFTNAIVLTAGISLNDLDFPAHSGTNVIGDNNGGPITITFATPVTNFGGYFTYGSRVTVDGFGAGNALVGAVNSSFTNNEALSGVLGSSPNELLQISSLGGISRVTVTGDPLALDDAMYTPAASSTPEPASGALILVSAGIVVLVFAYRRLRAG